MKTLKQFINESLVKSDHINEGIINIKDYRRFVKPSVTPVDKEELKLIIEDTIKKEGNRCDLNFIDTSKITDMSYLFTDSKFNGDISKWDVSNVKNMECMFENSIFNSDISDWDVSNVRTMFGMFNNSEFNRDISDWNVSNVKSMRGMFENSKFNGDISKWDVSNVKDMSDMFSDSLCKKYQTTGFDDDEPLVDENGHFVKI